MITKLGKIQRWVGVIVILHLRVELDHWDPAPESMKTTIFPQGNIMNESKSPSHTKYDAVECKKIKLTSLASFTGFH